MRKWLLIFISFLLAFMLTLVPMPEWAIWFRPAWIMLVLIYWNVTSPQRVNLGAACIVGIMLDLLNGTLLGEHAFAMIVTSYFVLKMQARIKMFPLLQQTFCVWLMVFLYQLLIYCIQGFIGELPKTKWYWASSFVSMLLWPGVASILKSFKRRSRLRMAS